MTIDTTSLPASSPATVDTGALVGNPRRTRGLDASALRPRQATTDPVGNPRRTRGLGATDFDAA